MIEEFTKNIETEILILRELVLYNQRIENASGNERVIIKKTVDALKNKIKIINKNLPAIIQRISLAQKLPSSVKTELPFERIETNWNGSNIIITLSKKDRKQFLEDLRISDNNIKLLHRKENVEIETVDQFRNPRFYLKMSNKIFLALSRRLMKKGYFESISKSLKQANMDILAESYVSIALLTTLLVVLVGIIFAVIFTLFTFNLSEGLIPYKGNFIVRGIEMLLIPLILGVITFFAIYFYPKTEKSDLERKISQELPFAVVYMSAVAGAGIEPSGIFKIIAMSPEYPYLRKEIRKVLNQINIYGYDMITALTNVSKNTPSQKLAELFSGLATTINSGGSLEDFFQKRSESLVIEYRLERE